MTDQAQHGPVDSTAKDTLREVQCIRHAVAHNAGVADEEFIKHCPHYEARLGEHVTVSPTNINRYFMAHKAYLDTLITQVMQAIKEAAGDLGMDISAVQI